MKLITNSAIALFLTAAALLSGCKDDDDQATPTGVGTVSFDVENVVGSLPLVLKTGTYTNAATERFTVSKFNYILSNFKLQKADGSEYAVPESYVLLSADATPNAASSGKAFTLKDIPAGDYTGLTFMVGVDAARNTAGAQTGALATTNGMYWDWNQGYIFLKMEGSWQKPDGTTGMVTYHLGGFTEPNNSLRTVAPTWPVGGTLAVRADHAPEVHLNVNLLQLLNGATATDHVSFATLPMVHMPGAGASQLATNLSGSSSAATTGTASMFRIDHIHAN
ncbi:hypothetical protein Q5H93_21840 [Hymenobacter sp. ASUV-10]|uniref:Copper-binding protein MbnP-like domain-containing protein n=1 Tax=Hymenobacter aranciens TaxID=3063996 RepID=A0ABT9BGJ7_9BACT|nr:MbnP family protein [Hymenobacter sp. ASUV-10]MDO7877398.1 hypothetical protein [Hymenobacter sp. ASUV-10]